MASSIHVFCLSLLFLFILSLNLSFSTSVKPQSIILPIRKDTKRNQYYTEIDIGTPKSIIYAVIDLGGGLLWFDCENGYKSSSYRPIACGTKRCEQAKGSGCLGCNLPARPGCTNNTCGTFPYNPYKDILAIEGLGEDIIDVSQTDGNVYLLSTKVAHLQFSCAHKSQLKGLANGTKGMIGLARTRTSLHKQLALAFKFPHKFALCIPRSNDNGFGSIFIGGGPYYVRPYGGDVSTGLITTPLIINPVSTAPISTEGDPSDEYFIGVKSIKVDGKLLTLNSTLLSIDKKGNGGTKISTIKPYTVLHTSIYKALVDDFVKKASLKKITRVASVAPFGACFSANSISSSMTGPNVPNIDLVLQSESVYWRIYGANSMVKVNGGAAYCLGFVNGGSTTTTSIVLGGHQLEDNLIEFDLETLKLGFTSSLLLKNTTCSQSRIF